MPTSVSVQAWLNTPSAGNVLPPALQSILSAYSSPRQARVRYGEEVPRKDWYDYLRDLVGAIAAHQRATPVYVPFAPGTPTLAARELLERARHQSALEALEGQRLGLEERRLALEAAGGGQTIGTPSWKAAQRSYLVARAKKALDEWWAQFPQGPSVPEVQKKIDEILDVVRNEAAMLGFSAMSGEIDDIVETVRDLLERSSGLKKTSGASGTSSTQLKGIDRLRPTSSGRPA